jgi:acyl-CoA synthetase (AMP-forming)/AMP-acid ligase II
MSFFAETDRFVMIEDGRCVCAADLLRASSDTRRFLRKHSLSRVLVSSAKPSHILRAIDACMLEEADLLIAHTTLSSAHLGRVCDLLQIQGTIGEEETIAHVKASVESSSSIFTMTSATTKFPKVARHSLRSLTCRLRTQSSSSSNASNRWLLTYPPTTYAGLQVMLTALLTGATLIATSSRSIERLYHLARDERVTHISATPTFWRSFLPFVQPGQLALRQVTLGGERVDQRILDLLSNGFGDARITHTYASTEAGLLYSVHDRKEGFPSAWILESPGADKMRIRNGVLEVNAAGAMRGYIGQRDQPFTADGWLSTGDRCEVRGDRAYIVGRMDRTINVGGMKVNPELVEDVLLQVPRVQDARVYGEPNPITGSIVCAEVVLHAGTTLDQVQPVIRGACKEILAPHEVPRVIAQVDRVATTALGKKA